MKITPFFQLTAILILLSSCSSSVVYTDEFKEETSGKYLFSADDIMTVTYQNDDMYIDWRGVKSKPVITGPNDFFMPDLYKKMHFVTHPKTGEQFLSEISKNESDSIRYDYIKVPDDYKTPSQYIKDKEFDKALAGLLKIKAQDSTNDYIKESRFNRIGYKYSKDKNYKDAIAIFEMNAKLHPNSSNVYDSLAETYLLSGDSLKAYENYKKVLELDNNNKRAQSYVNAYKKK